MEHNRLHVADTVSSLIDDDKTANRNIIDCLSQCFVVYVSRGIMVALRDEPPECREISSVEYPALHPRQQEPHSILAHPVDALHILAFLRLVAHEEGAS